VAIDGLKCLAKLASQRIGEGRHSDNSAPFDGSGGRLNGLVI
jgi:hypothetical protein